MNIKDLLGLSGDAARDAFVHTAAPYVMPGKPKLFAHVLVKLQVQACDLYRAARWILHHTQPRSAEALRVVAETQRLAYGVSLDERMHRGVE